jgi:hypothetical protein
MNAACGAVLCSFVGCEKGSRCSIEDMERNKGRKLVACFEIHLSFERDLELGSICCGYVLVERLCEL